MIGSPIYSTNPFSHTDKKVKKSTEQKAWENDGNWSILIGAPKIWAGKMKTNSNGNALLLCKNGKNIVWKMFKRRTN
jgi:hypothetical protein